MFTSGATGTVAGTQVDTGELRQSLQAVYNTWNAKSATFEPMDPVTCEPKIY
ncbi:hypothetical protein PHLCEN_2v7307, partial [Hermanssonia centrifuga]